MHNINRAAKALPPLTNVLLRALIPLGLLTPACAEPEAPQRASAGQAPTHDALDSEFRSHPGGEQGQTQAVAITLRVPSGKEPQDFIIVSEERTHIDENAHVGTIGKAGDSILAFQSFQMEVGAKVYGDVYAVEGVRLEDQARLVGNLTTPGVVLYRDGSKLDGVENRSAFEVKSVDYSFEAPKAMKDAVVADSVDLDTLAPGGYKGLTLTGNSTVTLTSGVYYFETLAIGPDAELRTDPVDGPVRVVVGNVTDGSGQFNQVGDADKLLFVVQGETEITFAKYFHGTLVAQKARVNILDHYEGAIFAYKVYIEPDALVAAGPFAWNSPVNAGGGGSEGGNPGSGSGGATLPPQQTPETLPAATPIERNCGAPLDVEYGDDADGDGEPDAVRVTAVAPAAGCSPTRYCRVVVGADGSETYEEVAPTPLYSDDFPVPAAAVTDSCAAVAGTNTCPTLSNGQPADNCEGIAEDTDCLTVTFCPEADAAEDPAGPGFSRNFTPHTIEKLNELMPDDVREIGVNEVARFDTDHNPLFIHPCEWEESVHSYDMGFDITGNKGGEGAECNTNEDCNSGECGKGEDDFFGYCTKAESKVRFDLDEGNGVVHVDSGAGIPEARSRVQRAAFFPSTSFDVKSTMLAYANVVIFGAKLPILNATIDSQVTECRHALKWSAEAFQLDSPIIAKLGGTLKGLDISVFSEGELDTGDDVTPDEEYQQCENAKQALWNQERMANEALHDALIATTFWNEAGASGTLINSREFVEERVQNYQYAVNGYLDALAEFKRQQDGAIIRERAVLVARHERGVEAGYSFTVMVGPVPVSVEVGATGSWGLDDMRVENGVRTQVMQDCDGVECMHVRTESSATPWSNLAGYAFGGVGGSVGPLKASVGITAELSLIRYETPLRSAFALERVTWRAEEAAQALRGSIPAPLQPVLGEDPAVLQDDRFLVQPQIAQFQAPFAIGGGIDSPDEVLTHASFLDGRIKLTAKVKLWFAKVKFEYPLFSWKGIEKSWKVADGNSGDALQGRIGMPVPNMVLLPRLQVNEEPGAGSPSEVGEYIRQTFDIRDNRGSNSHAENKVGTPWDDQRCFIQSVIR